MTLVVTVQVVFQWLVFFRDTKDNLLISDIMAQPGYRAFSNLVRASWEATAGERPRFYGFVTLFVLAYTFDLMVPWAIGYILGVFVEKGFTPEAYEHAWYGVLAYIGLRGAHALFHHYARYLQNTVAYHARMSTLSNVFKAFLAFPLKWHVNHHSGENLSKLHRSVGAVDSTIGSYLWQAIEGTVKLVLATVALLALDTWVALNVVGLAVVTLLAMVFFNRRVTENIRSNNAFYDKINRVCIDFLFNIVTVKMLKVEEAAHEYLAKNRNDGLEISKRISKFTEFKWGTVTFGYAIVLGSSLLIYFYRHAEFAGAFDVAEVYVLMNYLDKIFHAIGSFTGYYGGVIEASTAYEDAHGLLQDSEGFKTPPPASSLAPDWQRLIVSNLNFFYALGERGALSIKRLEIKRGDKIALVGPSGSGKSSLLKILSGILVPQEYSIQTESQANITIDDLAPHTLLLPQEPEIFSETVRYNLTLGDSYSLEALHFFISLCKAEHLIEKLPNNLDHNLSEKGLNLSVGEKQRIAMARGLLRAAEKQILLMDEPTSSLDPMTEKTIFFGLLHHFSDRTILTACHRLALVPLFDKIVYIRDGRIEEVGGFNELLERKGPFSLAWEDYQRRVVREEDVL